jgi:hypothetical protein
MREMGEVDDGVARMHRRVPVRAQGRIHFLDERAGAHPDDASLRSGRLPSLRSIQPLSPGTNRGSTSITSPGLNSDSRAAHCAGVAARVRHDPGVSDRVVLFS